MTHDDVLVTPSAGKLRQVLALLAWHAGQVVPAAMLIEELWGAEPPRSARNTLHTYIFRLRDRLGAASALATAHGGYLLHRDAVLLDTESYRQLAERGYQAARSGDHRAAARHLRSALRLWRGDALSGIPVGPELALAASQLEAERAATLDARVEAELRLGRHQDLIGELGALVEANPLHEQLCAHYMTALYLAGERDKALSVYRRLCQVLADRLGVPPAARLRELRNAMVVAAA